MKTGSRSLSMILYNTILMGNFDVFDGLLLDSQDIFCQNFQKFYRCMIKDTDHPLNSYSPNI